jgi:hypothetical protein
VANFTATVVDKGGKFVTGVVDTGGAPWLENISVNSNLWKIWNDPTVMIRGLGEDDLWKNLKQKSPDTVPLILVADIAANIWWLPLEAWDHQSCQHVATTSPHKTDHSSTSGLSMKCMGTTVQIIIHFCEFKGTAAQDFPTH